MSRPFAPRQITASRRKTIDIQEAPSDLEAARGARGRLSSASVGVDADADYTPEMMTSSSDDEDSLALARRLDTDRFVLRGRTLKWPDGARARLSDVGEVCTEVRLGATHSSRSTA